jgi:putative endopeptidase
MRRWKRAAAALALTLTGLGLLAADRAVNPGAVSGVDRSTFDQAVRPQDDLFRHVNGAWLAKSEIPAERAFYGSFIQLVDKSEADLRAILERAAGSDGGGSGDARKIGDLYTSFLDEERAERLGLKPVEDLLAKVDSVRDKADLVRTLAALQRAGVPGLFRFHVDTDAKRSDRYILYLSQGGIGLPDESFFREARFKDIRDAYSGHVGRMLALAKVEGAKEAAAVVSELETRLAKSHWDRVRSRDDTLTYNKKTRKELDQLTPGFDWAAFFDGIGAKGVEEVIVQQPDYFAAMAKALDEVPLERWKTWLTWHVLRANAPALSRAFVDESFAFYGKMLTGAKENRPRWKRAVAAVEGAMGEAAGRIYVEKYFPPAAKVRMQELVKNLIEAYREDIKALDWMSEETKKRALEKLAKFTPKIGYPDKWRDYSGLEIKPDDLAGNLRRADAFEIDYELGKLGKPVDRAEWHMTPQMVNAYYNPGMNEIVFPAAILQPPFFDMDADDAVNYGAIGAVIGHEIGHGFDDQGSKFDGDGNMVDWWTEADRREFDKRSKKLIEQYNGFSPAQLPGQYVNGALTIGENIGDLGGLTIAYKAYKRSLGGKDAPVIDGLTGDQRFFYGWAQAWRSKYRDAEIKRRLAVDPHSPTEFRCNGVVRNMPAFYDAFGVKQGDKLWLPPDQRVQIW